MAEENGHRTHLSAEDILSMDDLEVRSVYIPEWKTNVRFRVMPADVAQRFQRELTDPAKKNDAWIKIFALCAVDENGNRMFTDNQLERLRKKSTRVFMRMQTELLKLNGFTKETEDDLKNASGEAEFDASPTASPLH